MAVTQRSRRSSGRSGSVDELKTLVDSLIKENQKLKRQLARLEAKSIGGGRTSPERGLSTIARRIARALGATAGSARRARRSSGLRSARSTRSASGAHKTRKPASPETQAKRLAALARAREARAAKRAAAS